MHQVSPVDGLANRCLQPLSQLSMLIWYKQTPRELNPALRFFQQFILACKPFNSAYSVSCATATLNNPHSGSCRIRHTVLYHIEAHCNLHAAEDFAG